MNTRSVPAVTYFQPWGTSAIVQEIPERMDDADQAPARSPLDVMFSYRLSTQAFTARELARWALKPVPVARYQPRPPRLISFFGRTESGRANSGPTSTARTSPPTSAASS